MKGTWDKETGSGEGRKREAARASLQARLQGEAGPTGHPCGSMAAVPFCAFTGGRKVGETVLLYGKGSSGRGGGCPRSWRAVTADFIILHQYLPAGRKATFILVINTKKRECHH